MHAEQPAIEVRGLVRKFKRTDAVDGLNLRVEPGRCYGFFGRNGAGKTTTIKCLLNLIRPTAGEVRVFGLDPARADVAVKSRLAYVPDFVAFYPWMTVRRALDYCAAFRSRWNVETERALLDQFRLDETGTFLRNELGRFVRLARGAGRRRPVSLVRLHQSPLNGAASAASGLAGSRPGVHRCLLPGSSSVLYTS